MKFRHVPPITAGVAQVQALPPNEKRRYALFLNDGTGTLYLAIGQDAVVNGGIRLNPSGGAYEMIQGQNLAFDKVMVISTAAGCNFLVIEGEGD